MTQRLQTTLLPDTKVAFVNRLRGKFSEQREASVLCPIFPNIKDGQPKSTQAIYKQFIDF